MRDVLILGGYGNFGKRIAAGLAQHGVPVVIAGRHLRKAEACAADVRALCPQADVGSICLDAETGLDAYLSQEAPAVVVNTCGPFQGKDYAVASCCIRHRVAYIDLADGRDFVAGIKALDAAADAAGVAVISGASTVPGLSSAVLDHYRSEFATIEDMRFGISPGQKAERGLATTQAILGYLGKRLKPIPGDLRPRYGWQDLYQQSYPGLGKRWMANCDVPDLDLLPPLYGIQRIRFSAGMENRLIHFTMFGLSWLVRAGVPLGLDRHAASLLRISALFDAFGSSDGGMHVILRGKDLAGRSHERCWFIVAKDGAGPHIPCVPAIVLAKRLASGETFAAGARACLGLVSLDDFKAELASFPVCFHDGERPPITAA